MRPGPATQTAFVRGFLLALSPLGGGRLRRNDRFSPTAPALSRTASAAFAKASYCSRSRNPRSYDQSILRSIDPMIGGFRDHELQLLRLPVDHSRSEEQDRGGGRNAWASSSRLRAFPNVPRRFTLANHRRHWLSPQSFGELRNAHVSMNLLSATMLLPAIQKPASLVQKLWTMCLPCGSPRKSKN
jgi:hypothetical protein